MSAVLEAFDLTVRAGARTLLGDVSMAVRTGEVLAVVGANGAGKSTLLRALAGDRRYDAGRVTLDGRQLSAWSPESLARRRGVLLQDSSLAFPFTALDVALMGRAPHGGHRSRDTVIARAALAAVGLETLAHRTYPTMSGGEKQRVQLARVLAQLWGEDLHEPLGGTGTAGRVLLLDEPVASLDLAQQHHTLLLARQLASQGVAVLAVLHDLNLAAQYADRVAVLRAGQLVSIGAPTYVLNADTVELAFGVPVMVVEHPCADCPLVVPAGRGAEIAVA